MTTVFAAVLIILLSIFLVLIRALRGPTVHDRILAVNLFGSKTVILLVLLGFVIDPQSSRVGFLDIALLYALINFLATVAILKFVEFRRLG